MEKIKKVVECTEKTCKVLASVGANSIAVAAIAMVPVPAAKTVAATRVLSACRAIGTIGLANVAAKAAADGISNEFESIYEVINICDGIVNKTEESQEVEDEESAE